MLPSEQMLWDTVGSLTRYPFDYLYLPRVSDLLGMGADLEVLKQIPNDKLKLYLKHHIVFGKKDKREDFLQAVCKHAKSIDFTISFSLIRS